MRFCYRVFFFYFSSKREIDSSFLWKTASLSLARFVQILFRGYIKCISSSLLLSTNTRPYSAIYGNRLISREQSALNSSGSSHALYLPVPSPKEKSLRSSRSILRWAIYFIARMREDSPRFPEFDRTRVSAGRSTSRARDNGSIQPRVRQDPSRFVRRIRSHESARFARAKVQYVTLQKYSS